MSQSYSKPATRRTHAQSNMDTRWQHPFTAIIAGPTSSGKSWFIKNLLRERSTLVCGFIEEVIYCAPEGQAVDPDIPCTAVYKGIPDVDMFTDLKPRIVILDDLMREANGSLVDLFTKGSHHYNLSVIFVTQNIFNQGKGQRDISLNAHYLVCFKNPRDKQQILHLSKQISPENPKYIQEAYNDATAKPFGYLLFDLRQTTPDIIRYRTNIFKADNPSNIVYVPKSRAQ